MTQLKTIRYLSLAAAVFVVAALPEVAYANGFSGMGYALLIMLPIMFVLALGSLIAAAVTADNLAARMERQWIWLLYPVFVACWFGIGWIVIYLTYVIGAVIWTFISLMWHFFGF